LTADVSLDRRRLFICALLVLFAMGVAASTRAAIASDLRAALFDPVDLASAGERIGSVLGAAFAGFAATLLIVSPLLDKLGMRRAVFAAVAALLAGIALVIFADRIASGPAIYAIVTTGMVLQGIAWGLTEATVNPMTTALYPDDRIHRLNVLHAWWPAGLVTGGLAAVFMGQLGIDWRWILVLAVLPAILAAIIAAGLIFPQTERAAAGIPDSAMWAEFLRSPAIFGWIILMLMTASSELAPGQWVDLALSRVVGMRGILLLVYVSALMFVMRHFAGTLVHRLSSTGLLAISSALASIGLFGLSVAASPATALLAATAWGAGVCFMWPTMLASVASRFPRGGSLFIGVVGAAGASASWLVLPVLGRIYDNAKVAAAGGQARFETLSGAELEQTLAIAATASFRAVAFIPLTLVVLFGLMAMVEAQMSKKKRIQTRSAPGGSL
jgi:MFS family permease